MKAAIQCVPRDWLIRKLPYSVGFIPQCVPRDWLDWLMKAAIQCVPRYDYELTESCL